MEETTISRAKTTGQPHVKLYHQNNWPATRQTLSPKQLASHTSNFITKTTGQPHVKLYHQNNWPATRQTLSPSCINYIWYMCFKLSYNRSHDDILPPMLLCSYCLEQLQNIGSTNSIRTPISN